MVGEGQGTSPMALTATATADYTCTLKAQPCSRRRKEEAVDALNG